MIYFDNAATGGRKQRAVVQAVLASIEGVCANPGRSGHALAAALAKNLSAARGRLCSFFGNTDPDRTVFTRGCTEALNIALFSLPSLQTNGRLPHVVTTAAEHNAVLRPLLSLRRAGKIALTVVPLREGHVPPEDIAAAVREDTVACAFTLASNVTGAAIDPAAVRAHIPPHVLTVCDGAQACGHIPVHMQEAGIDALCVAGHKGMGGIQGSGALLFSARFDPLPLLFGGSGVLSADEDMPPFYPERLEAGTLSYPAILSLAEGTLHLQLHMERESRRLLRLTRQLHAGLQEIDGLRLYSMPNPFGIAAFACPALQSELFAQRLSDEYAIAVRGGLHCAPRMHAELGTAECGLVRASLSPANTAQEVRAFLSAVRAVAENV